MGFRTTNNITPEELWARLQKGEKVKIVDVREPGEWMLGHIPGATHIPLGQLFERTSELDPKEETILVCHSGGRSALAYEMLSEKGFSVVNMLGGMSSWTGDVE